IGSLVVSVFDEEVSVSVEEGEVIPMVGGERLVVGAEQSVGEFGFPDGGKEAREVVAGVEGGEPVLEPVLVEQVGASFADEVLVYFDETGAVSDAVEKRDL